MGGQTHKHTDTHINTMTRPGLGAGPSENPEYPPVLLLNGGDDHGDYEHDDEDHLGGDGDTNDEEQGLADEGQGAGKILLTNL